MGRKTALMGEKKPTAEQSVETMNGGLVLYGNGNSL